MNDSIVVRWESADGWREGVLCAVLCDQWHTVDQVLMRREILRGAFAKAVIWDRHRSEPCVVPLGMVRLVEPRCSKCDGEGWVDVTAVATAMRERCECQEVPNA